MDEETLTRYAAAYQMPADAIRAWFDNLPPNQQRVVALCFRRGRAPEPRDGDNWLPDYLVFEQASVSFAALAAAYLQEALP